MTDKKYSNPNLSSGSKNTNHKSSTSDLFLNIIISLLGIAILVMAYLLVSKLLGSRDDPASGKNKQSVVQVEVLNGCGVSGVADKITDYLRKNNFDVVQTGNYTSYDMDKSLVIDRTGNKVNAEKVATALGINKKNIVQQINYDYLLDCSIVIGRDYFQLKPYNQ